MLSDFVLSLQWMEYDRHLVTLLPENPCKVEHREKPPKKKGGKKQPTPVCLILRFQPTQIYSFTKKNMKLVEFPIHPWDFIWRDPSLAHAFQVCNLMRCSQRQGIAPECLQGLGANLWSGNHSTPLPMEWFSCHSKSNCMISWCTIMYVYLWVFPKIGGKPPKSCILIGFGTIIFTIHFGGFTTPIFGNTHILCISQQKENLELEVKGFNSTCRLRNITSYTAESYFTKTLKPCSPEKKNVQTWNSSFPFICSFQKLDFWGMRDGQCSESSHYTIQKMQRLVLTPRLFVGFLLWIVALWSGIQAWHLKKGWLPAESLLEFP